MKKQPSDDRPGKGGDEEPQETERGEKREKGSPDLDPKPENDKGELTEEAIKEGEKGTS